MRRLLCIYGLAGEIDISGWDRFLLIWFAIVWILLLGEEQSSLFKRWGDEGVDKSSPQ